jgi:phosphatidylinositol-3-phosphatase
LTAPDDNGGDDSLRAVRCAACSSRLAHDQRYCTECGTRRGPLPRRFSELIGTALEQGDGAALDPDATAEDLDPGGDGPAFPQWMPAPRAVAVGILLMIAFGAYAGSLFSPTAESLARQLIVVVSPAPTPAPTPAASANGSGSGGGGGGGGSTQITQTITVGGGGGQTGGGATSTSSTSTTNSAGNATSNPALHLPPIHHVFLIVLSSQDYFQTFGPVSSDHYLSKTLPKQGELIQDYYGVAGSPLANGMALISGQGPTFETAIDCPLYSPVTPGTSGSHGQVLGGGCVYPPNALTVADQLAAVHLTWRTYVQGIGGTNGKPTACVYPSSDSPDNHATPSRREPYVTWRNPFVYFSSLTDGSACRQDDVGLGKLTADVKKASTAPTLSYIIPSPCDDGSDQPCTPGAAIGLAPADHFLKSILPEIEHSAAYKDNGLIAITFDQAPQTGPHADHSSCCGPSTYPNLPATSQTNLTSLSTSTSTSPSTSTLTPATTTTTTTTSTSATGSGALASPTGGGQVGILLISPFISPNTTDVLDSYNHFSLLRSIEDLFGLPHLGFAGDRGLPSFNTATYNKYAG